MTTQRTIISRANGYTAVWFGGWVISAWLDETGDSVNRHGAHVLTKDPAYPAPPVPPNPEDLGPSLAPGLKGLSGLLARWRTMECKHGLPFTVCMTCGSDPRNVGGFADA